MKRKIYDKLLEWKQRDAPRYALMIDGARRVGKSYIAEEFVDTHDLALVDRTKRGILNIYRGDIQKYSGRLVERVEGIWDEIPGLLSKHEKRFRPTVLGKGIRMRDCKDAFQWPTKTRRQSADNET